jgi:hypothetical protein
MSDQHFPMMLKLLVASTVILILVTLTGLSPFFSILGIIPLVKYHVQLSRESKKGLSSSAVDSVYYFGFLVTVVALACTAIHISWNAGATDTSAVVLQFGVGLFATGYAVVART